MAQQMDAQQRATPVGSSTRQAWRQAIDCLWQAGASWGSALSLMMCLVLADAITPASAQIPLEDVVQVAAGFHHSCALTTTGGVKCWGNNSSGQLGDNSFNNRPVASYVSGLTGGVSAISAGGQHTCALTSGGGVKCWGRNFEGQLGDNTNTLRLTAVDVIGLASGVIAIAAGAQHTCALTSGGGVKCWGANGFGRLGDNSTTQRLTPVDVFGLSNGVSAITAGGQHTCALTSSSGVKCWGAGFFGQIGNNSPAQRLTPVDVSGLTSGVSAIAAGNSHTCALTTSGGAKCWGNNSSGELGDNTTTQRLTPINVAGLSSGYSAISTGDQHTCALSSTGGAKCWGSNFTAQLGDNSTTQRLTAVDVSGLGSGVNAIAAGGGHTCAMTTSGEAKCWGLDTSGQLGDNRITTRLIAVDAVGLSGGVGSIHAGTFHSCALTVTGGVKCWGEGFSGQLGRGGLERQLVAADVIGLTNGVSSVATGNSHTCALTSGGGVKCWGQNFDGQLGDNSTTGRFTAVDVVGLTSGVSAVATGNSHTCALTGGGGVKCWGQNSNGQLGDNSTTQRLTPVDVEGLSSGVSAISAGGSHTCALTTGGGVKCWGANNGRLGDNTTTQRLTPVDVDGLNSGVSAITAGGLHTCALTSVGGVKCWGGNLFGGLGDNSTTTRLTAVDVSGLSSGVSAIWAGSTHTCALTTSGGVKCWGANFRGHLGDGTTTQRLAPVDVSGLTSDVSAVAPGAEHTCALTSNGAVKCWGQGQDGQLGDVDSAAYVITPVTVLTSTVPGAPTILSAIAGDGQAIVAFSAPGLDGGSAISGYTATSDPPGFSSSGCTASPCSVTGLTNGTAYTFTVTATNAIGSSPASAPSNSVTPRADQILVFNSAPTVVVDGTGTVSATGGASGNPVIYASVDTDICTVTGDTVTGVSVGSCVIAANQAGSAAFNAATEVTQSFTIGQGSQAISFGTPPTVVVDGTGTVSATGGASNNAVVFTAQDTNICTVSGSTVTGVSVGICTIASNQAGNANYLAAPEVTQSFTIGQGSQVIQFGSLANRQLGDPPFTVTASGGASGNPVTFSSRTTTVCTTSGNNGTTITLLLAGTCTLRASQAGSINYAAALDVEQSFTVSAGTATVTLDSNLNPANAGQSVTLTATVTGFAPTGTVSLRDGSNALSGCVALPLVGAGNTLTAECSTSTLPAGNRSLIADYSGDPNNAAGSSDTLIQVINALPTVSTPPSLSLLEDSAAVDVAITVGDLETAAGDLSLVATSSNTTLFPPASLLLGGSVANRTLSLIPAADHSGSATITLSVTDAGGAQASTTFEVNVTAVNDAPSLTILGNRTHGPGSSGVQTVPSFATASPGANEETQTISFPLVAVDDPSQVVTNAVIAANGTLTYTLSGSSGAARFRVTAVDDGGTADGGVDTSEPREFLILVGTGANVGVSISRLQPNHASLISAMAQGATVANYAIDVTNNGPDAVAGLRVDVPAPLGLNNVLWTCSAPGGSCAPANGAATVLTLFNLGPDQTARTELSAEVNTAASFVEITAIASLPQGVPALGTGNLRAVFIEPANVDAVFKSGFE